MLDEKEQFSKLSNRKITIPNSHSFSISIFFICVTISAWVFHNPNLLNWYIVAIILELIYKEPNFTKNYKKSHNTKNCETDNIDGGYENVRYRKYTDR